MTHQSAEDADRPRPARLRVSRVQDQARRQADAAADRARSERGVRPGALYAYPREKSIRHFKDQIRQLTRRKAPVSTRELIQRGQSRRAWMGPVLQAGPRPKALPPTRPMARAANLVASIQQMALLWLDNVCHARKLYGEFGLVNLVALIPSIATQRIASS